MSLKMDVQVSLEYVFGSRIAMLGIEHQVRGENTEQLSIPARISCVHELPRFL